MVCNICKCGSPLSNLGHECTSPFGVPALAVFVPTFDSDGNLNGIPKNTDLNKAYFDLMTSAATPADKRWYPTPLLKNIENERADAKFWEADDQSVEFVSETARTFKAIVAQTSGTGATAPAMKKQIESARCSDGLSVFIISDTRQILCKDSADGLSVLPINIDAQSVYVGFVFAKKGVQNQHLMLQFNFSALENDGDLKLIDCAEINDYDILMLKALLDLCYDLVDITPNDITIKIHSNFGSAINPPVEQGLLVADFVSSDTETPSKIFNATTAADVTISGVVENPAGTYKLSFSAPQTLGDVLVPYALKTGKDFTCMKNNPVDIDS